MATLSENSTTINASSVANKHKKGGGVSNFIEIGKGLMSDTPAKTSRNETIVLRFKSANKAVTSMNRNNDLLKSETHRVRTKPMSPNESFNNLMAGYTSLNKSGSKSRFGKKKMSNTSYGNRRTTI